MSSVTVNVVADQTSDREKDRRVRAFRLRRLNDFLLALAGWLIFLTAWQLLPRLGVLDPMFSSSPAGWMTALWKLIFTGAVFVNLGATLFEMGVGLALAIVIGVPLGIVFAWYRVANRMTSSLTSAFYAVPYVALVPLIIIWFGIGDAARIAIVFWGALFPILLNTMSGVKNLDRGFLRVSKAFCAPQIKTLLTVVLPGALPYALAGVRLAIGRALVAAVVSEFFMGSRGVGYFISQTASAFDMDDAFAGIVLISATGVILVQLVSLIESKFSSWTHAE